MINEMKNSRSSDLLPMFYDCKYFSLHSLKWTRPSQLKNCQRPGYHDRRVPRVVYPYKQHFKASQSDKRLGPTYLHNSPTFPSHDAL